MASFIPKIWQITHDEQTIKSADPVLYKYHNKQLTQFYENEVIAKLLYSPSLLSLCSHTGVTSPSFTEKTGLNGRDLLGLVKEHANKDAIIYSPWYWNDVNESYGTSNLFIINREISKRDNDPTYFHVCATLLNDSGVLPFDLFETEWFPCSHNFWVAQKKVFADYVNTVLEPAMNFLALQQTIDQLKDFVQIYKGGEYPIEPFVLEMLFGLYITYNKLDVYSHFDPANKIKAGEPLQIGNIFRQLPDGTHEKVSHDQVAGILGLPVPEPHTGTGSMPLPTTLPPSLQPKDAETSTFPLQLLPDAEPRPIIGFWHICLLNNYLSIISEQVDLLISSGLYKACSSIIVSCVGNDRELVRAKKILEPYPKISIVVALPNISEYEFPALELIKQMADVFQAPKYLFYIHTKGVNYPTNNGVRHWRDYMNHYNITCWRDAVRALQKGYDTCGVKLVYKEQFSMHYSGNFWWATSEHIKRLPEIDTLNRKDRFEAEMWLCKSYPLAYSLCDKFVDANTEGDFTPPVQPNGRNFVHTLAFNTTDQVALAIHLLHEQNPDASFRHIIADIGFPLVKGDEIPPDIEAAKQINTSSLMHLAREYKSAYLQFANVGVSQNWDRIRHHVYLENDDVLICADPDERPQNAGWVNAIAAVLRGPERLAWCSLMMKEHLPLLEEKGMKTASINGYRVYIMDDIFSWAQGGFHGRFLNEIGGVPVPDGAGIYGWIEHACHQKIKQYGYRWAILADYFVEHTDDTPIYRKWKTHVTSNVSEGQMQFEDWLGREALANSH